MKSKKLIVGAATLAAVFLLTACNTGSTKDSSAESESTATSSSVDLSKVALPQLSTEVAKDEDLVELVTTEGNIKIKLFPKYAPKAVENFMTHAKDGYYKDTTFHRVVKDFMIQGGDPKGDGTGGESIWKDGFTTEISPSLYHIRGALSMARGEALDSQGSQFFIVQNDKDATTNLAKQFTPEKIIDAYKKGGTPQLDGNYTVFGQVTEGMDVVDKIANAEMSGASNSLGEDSTPKEPVKIKEVKVLQEAK